MTVVTAETVSTPPRHNALLSLLGNDQDLYRRFCRIRDFSRKVRASEYHITNACNIRCKGCWFFVHEFDKKTRDLKDIGAIRDFVRRQRDEQGITAGILIGGEPAVVPDRVSVFVEELDYVTISTNGLKKLPMEGFERVSVLISLFGGGRLDAIRGRASSMQLPRTAFPISRRPCGASAITATAPPSISTASTTPTIPCARSMKNA